MPKKAKELKALEVRRLSKGTHRVGGCTGLCLSVVSETNKYWTLRVRIGLKDQEIGLGSYPTVTLEDARRLGRECHEKIKEGINPIEATRVMGLIDSYRRTLELTEIEERLQALENSY